MYFFQTTNIGHHRSNSQLFQTRMYANFLRNSLTCFQLFLLAPAMKYFTALLMLFCSLFAAAQNGYEIKITLKPFRNQYVYLGHYYGKQLPIIDSALLNDKSEGVFKGTKKLGSGVYLIGYPDRGHNFEILIDKNQKFSIVADTAKIQSMSFKNSPENVEFKSYQQFMMRNGSSMDSLAKRKKIAEKDSAKIDA